MFFLCLISMDSSCEKCHGTGVVKEADGSVHTCWICLAAGRMDTHSKKVDEFKQIKV